MTQEELVAAENDPLATQNPLTQDQMVVATVLCQAYHYMITSGLSYGYVTSGECLVVRAIKDAANVLYFYFVPSLANVEGLPAANTVKGTPAATLTMLALLALAAKVRPQEWVEEALNTLPRWPSSKQVATSRSQDGGGPSSLPLEYPVSEFQANLLQ